MRVTCTSYARNKGDTVMAPSKWTTKHSSLRYVYAILKNIQLTLQPLAISLGVVGVWYWFFWEKHHFGEADSERLLLLTGPLLMLALLFIGGVAYTKVDERKAKTVNALMMKRRDAELARDMFLANREERTSNVLLVFLGSVSIFLTIQAMMTHWDGFVAGFFAVFVCSFVSAKFWAIITRLDNPVKSCLWIRERTPQDWLDADIDEHFHLCDGVTPQSRDQN